MISGQQDPRVVELAYEAGVDHYLPKPLDQRLADPGDRPNLPRLGGVATR